MRQFLSENREIIIAIISIIVAILGSSTTFLGIRNHTLHKRLDALKRQGYQIRCPRCKKEIPLAEVDILMPDGSVDNNLNGIDDEKE